MRETNQTVSVELQDNGATWQLAFWDWCGLTYTDFLSVNVDIVNNNMNIVRCSIVIHRKIINLKYLCEKHMQCNCSLHLFTAFLQFNVYSVYMYIYTPVSQNVTVSFLCFDLYTVQKKELPNKIIFLLSNIRESSMAEMDGASFSSLPSHSSSCIPRSSSAIQASSSGSAQIKLRCTY